MSGGISFNNYPWWLSANFIPDIWQKTTGAGVKIAVLDTGVDTANQAFGKQVVKVGYSAIQEGLPVGNGIDTVGHGTECIGMIIGNDPTQTNKCFGVAPDCSIYSYQIFNSIVGDKPSFFTQGINDALADKVDIISVSRNITLTDDVKAQVHKAINNKVFVIVCGGNYPDSANELLQIDGVIKVGAIGQNQTDVFAGTSINAADPNQLDVHAPGINISSIGLNNSVTTGLNGTSFSTPFIAGVFALKIQKLKAGNQFDYNSILKDFNNSLQPNTDNLKILNIQQFIT